MKVQRIRPTVPPTNKPSGRAGRLSDDAFYLIALALLIKKESGASSLSQYLFPGGLSISKDKTAA